MLSKVVKNFIFFLFVVVANAKLKSGDYVLIIPSDAPSLGLSESGYLQSNPSSEGLKPTIFQLLYSKENDSWYFQTSTGQYLVAHEGNVKVAPRESDKPRSEWSTQYAWYFKKDSVEDLYSGGSSDYVQLYNKSNDQPLRHDFQWSQPLTFGSLPNDTLAADYIFIKRAGFYDALKINFSTMKIGDIFTQDDSDHELIENKNHAFFKYLDSKNVKLKHVTSGKYLKKASGANARAKFNTSKDYKGETLCATLVEATDDYAIIQLADPAGSHLRLVGNSGQASFAHTTDSRTFMKVYYKEMDIISDSEARITMRCAVYGKALGANSSDGNTLAQFAFSLNNLTKEECVLDLTIL